MNKQNMDEIIESAPQNQLIQNTLQKMNLKLTYYRNPVCSVSGGSDSDIMIDLIERVRFGRSVTYVWFDTGIEYEATKRHLKELETKYGITIERRKAVVPVPLGCKTYGLPFFSKQVSEFMDRLQQHNFQWKDEPFDVLKERYQGCESALKWWCNKKAEDSSYNIDAVPNLKKFIVQNPPTFLISQRCCEGGKKNPAGNFYRENGAGMKIIGLRRAEGGVRATAYSSCFSIGEAEGDVANYRPLWFWSNADKAKYKEFYGITYSDCYEVWGFKRTGCAGCPFNSRFEDDMMSVQQYEPKLYKVVNNIFGPSYEYTRAYRRFKAQMEERKKTGFVTQMSIDDIMEPTMTNNDRTSSEAQGSLQEAFKL